MIDVEVPVKDIPEQEKRSIIPNLLSISRIASAPFLFLAIKDRDLVWTVILVFFAMLTDYLDGFLARKIGRISNAGKILDPIADKICLASGALALGIYGDLPLSLLALILLRDTIIGLLGVTIIKKAKKVPVSNMIGKVTVFMLSVSMVIYILQLEYLYSIAYLSAVIFIVVSSISYLWASIKLISN